MHDIRVLEDHAILQVESCAAGGLQGAPVHGKANGDIDVGEANGVKVAIITSKETDGLALADISLELLSKGRELADRLDTELAAFMVGHGITGLAELNRVTVD